MNIDIAAPFDVMAMLALVAALVITALHVWEGNLRGRAACLRAAADTLEKCHARAQQVLADPATPGQIKDLIVAFVSAISDDRIGRTAFEALVEILSQEHEAVRKDQHNVLEAFRHHSPDGYEATADCLRAAVAVLFLVHGPDHDAIEMEVRATTMQSVTFALAQNVEDLMASIGLAGERARV